MIEESPRGEGLLQMRKQLDEFIVHEIRKSFDELSTMVVLSSDCQQALATAYARGEVEAALESLIKAGKSMMHLFLERFWPDVGGWEPEHHSVLVAALETFVANVQALYKIISLAAEYLRAQGGHEYPEKIQILLWATPRLLLLDCGDIFEASEGAFGHTGEEKTNNFFWLIINKNILIF